ncbi:uncharacterized protein PRCAT00000805001 [Priceomyces carsonii]|uniref:uncharacterized protein n=1 Tax=Priceomyces carsonii TaxID=28549 RepID=UPI002EDA176D|nr:unnamed protein product [Priceomyces carsonii]
MKSDKNLDNGTSRLAEREFVPRRIRFWRLLVVILLLVFMFTPLWLRFRLLRKPKSTHGWSKTHSDNMPKLELSDHPNADVVDSKARVEETGLVLVL